MGKCSNKIASKWVCSKCSTIKWKIVRPSATGRGSLSAYCQTCRKQTDHRIKSLVL